MPRRTPFRPRAGSRRQVTWIGPADQAFVAVASTMKVILASFDPAGAGLAKPTVVRTRGEVAIRPPSATITDLQVVGAFGVAIVSDRAFAAGAASIPGPFTDAGWDGWFVWGSFHYVQEQADATGIYLNFHTQIVDSKAMRKVTDDETVVFMAESQSGAFSISMPFRMLLKLS